ncbi:MAG: hypothetical protein Q9172_006856 [Xanthocarpia lactea]
MVMMYKDMGRNWTRSKWYHKQGLLGSKETFEETFEETFRKTGRWGGDSLKQLDVTGPEAASRVTMRVLK